MNSNSNTIYLISFIILTGLVIVIYSFNFYYIFNYLFNYKRKNLNLQSSDSSKTSSDESKSIGSSTESSDSPTLIPTVTIIQTPIKMSTSIPSTTPSQIGNLTEEQITPLLKTLAPDLVGSISNNTLNSLLISEKIKPRIIKSLTINQLLFLQNGNFKQLYRKNVVPYLTDMQKQKLDVEKVIAENS
jgi:hypothetical protein